MKQKRINPIKQTEASKKSSSDFGSASNAASKIGKAFNPLFAHYKDKTMINNLRRHVLAVFKTIPPAFAGNKKLIQGNVKLLNGFQFNSLKRLDLLLLNPPKLDLSDGQYLDIEFVAKTQISLLKEVAKAKTAALQVIVYNMDLNGTADETISGNPLHIPMESNFCGAKLRVPLVLNGERLVLMALSIHFTDGKVAYGSKRTKAGAIIFSKLLKDGIEIPFLAEEEEVIATAQKPEGLDWVLFMENEH